MIRSLRIRALQSRTVGARGSLGRPKLPREFSSLAQGEAGLMKLTSRATLKRTASEANGSTEDSSKRLRRSEEDAGEDLDMQD